jgi:zinc transport system substrate-binding protein
LKPSRLRSLIVSAALLAAAAAHAEPPGVVASIAPVHSLVASVMEGVGEPALLVPAAASDHDYSLKPSDLRSIAGADLVVWIGPPLETYLVKPLKTEHAGSLPLIESAAVNARSYDAGGDHAHAAEATGEASEHAAEAEAPGNHGALALDPHVWLDPVRAEVMVTVIAEALAELDPENAGRYRANAAATVDALKGLDAEIRGRLAPLAGIPFVTFHDGYSYFVERYGLNQVGQLAVHPERSPGAAAVRGLQGRIAAEGVACVFVEPQFDPRALETLAGEADIEIGILDAIGSGLEPGPSLYASLMRRNTEAMAECLSRRS